MTSQLSGEFCASLNFIDKAASVQPRFSFRPEGVVAKDSLKNNSAFYASLSHESVCTENLTPWKKLLPCFAKSGLASLLNAVHLFNTNYMSIALDLRPVCRVRFPIVTSISSLILNKFTGRGMYSYITGAETILVGCLQHSSHVRRETELVSL